MTVARTIQLVGPYVETVDAPFHLSSLFAVPPGGIHNKSKVQVHIRRTKKDISFPIADPSTGYHMNQRRGFSIKELAPAVYKEGIAISADDIMDEYQSFGMDPYKNPALMRKTRDEVGIVMTDLNLMIRRGLELQASQIMQSCTLTLVNDSGNTVFSEDFAPKAAHFPNASVAWTTTATAVPLTDIADLCDVIYQNGKRMPERIHMNSKTLAQMKATDSVKAAMDVNYKMTSGEFYSLKNTNQSINPLITGGGILRGVIEARNYALDLYVYDGDYNHPETDVITKYISDNKVIIESGGRMDATFGKINNFGTDNRANSYLVNGRLSSRQRMADLTVVAWISPDGSILNIGIGTRALLYPVATDTFGCLTTAGF